MLTLDQVRATNAPVEGPTGPLPDEAGVVIVGAGPVGLTCANLLGARGVRTLLVEQNPRTSDQPRAITVDDEHMRLIDRMGLMDAMRPHLTTTPYGIRFYSPLGFELVRADGFVTPNGFGNRNSVSQPMLEKVLLDGTRRYASVDIRYRCRLVRLTDAGDHVDLAVRDQTGREKTVRAAWVLGCDGANSFVRKAVGVDFVGRRIDEPHLVIDFAEFPDQSPYSRFFCNPRRPFNSILVPYGGRRIEFMLNRGEDHDAIRSPAMIADLVRRHTPYQNVDLKIVRSAVYGFSARVAARLGRGRVFLLGDAAHVMPPFGGQGLNTGARDAANLTWKIAAVLGGAMAPASLDSYDPERRPQVEDIIRYSVRIGRLANIRSWPLALARDLFFAVINLVPAVRRYFRAMRYMPRPRILEGLLVPDGRADSLVGRPMPRLMLRDARGEHVLDVLTEGGFALVGIDVAPALLAEAARHPLWQLLAPCLIGVTPETAEPRDGYRLAGDTGRAQIAAHAGEILAVRPDCYVAGAATPERFGAVSEALARRMAPDNQSDATRVTSRFASDHAAGITCCTKIASPMPAMPAPSSRRAWRSADRRAARRMTDMAAMAIALWTIASPKR